MRLNSEQTDWFERVRRQWYEKVMPNPSLASQTVFEVGSKLPQSAVRDAVLFANRVEALDSLSSNARVAEVGTQAGWYAEQIIQRKKPAELHLFDLEFNTLRSARSQVADDERVKLHVGDSSTELDKLPDRYFDWIYIDGDHSLSGVQRDAEVAVRKVKPGGTLIFNDYTLWSVLEFTDYGIVPVVNKLLASGEWRMVYLALHPLMYCDVAITRNSVTGWTKLLPTGFVRSFRRSNLFAR